MLNNLQWDKTDIRKRDGEFGERLKETKWLYDIKRPQNWYDDPITMHNLARILGKRGYGFTTSRTGFYYANPFAIFTTRDIMTIAQHLDRWWKFINESNYVHVRVRQGYLDFGNTLSMMFGVQGIEASNCDVIYGEHITNDFDADQDCILYPWPEDVEDFCDPTFVRPVMRGFGFRFVDHTNVPMDDVRGLKLRWLQKHKLGVRDVLLDEFDISLIGM
jgi:hypothetical protein